MIPKVAGGVGAANDATIVVENNVSALSAALDEARQREKDMFYYTAVDNAKSYVAKLEAGLDGAKSSLKSAEAELATYEASKSEPVVSEMEI